MDLGFFDLETSPTGIARTVGLVEAAGYESYWRGEHLVLVDPQVPPSPADPRTPMLDLVVSLTWAAAHSTRIKLGTGILLLPQRNPVVAAKEWASFDHMSGGRLLLGVGVGSIEQEYRALGIDFHRRGAMLDEHLEVLSTLWYDERPEHHGRFADVAGVDAYPRPVQEPVPIVVGGHSPAAYRRSVARAHGWYGFRLDPDGVRIALDELRRAADVVERPAALGRLTTTISPTGRLTPGLVDAYRDLGVDRLVTFAARGDDGVERSIDSTRAALGLT